MRLPPAFALCAPPAGELTKGRTCRRSGELLIGKRINSGAFALVYVGRYQGEVRARAGPCVPCMVHPCCYIWRDACLSTHTSHHTAPRHLTPCLLPCPPRPQVVAVKVLRSERVAPRDYVRAQGTNTPAGVAACSPRRPAPPPLRQATYTKEVNLIKSFDHPHVLGFVGVCCEPPHVCIGALGVSAVS